MRLQKWALMAAAVVACSTGAAMAQLSAVGNPGFESAITYDVPPAVGNWVAFFGGPPAAVLDSTVSTAQAHTGAQSIHISVSGAGGSFTGVQQPATGVEAGNTYTLRFWVKAGAAINNPVEHRIEWKDSSGAFVGGQFDNNVNIQTQVTSDWQQITWTGVAPAGATGATIVFAVQTFGFDPLNPVFNTEVFIDDVTFTAPPTNGACCNRGTAACVVVTPAICNALGGQMLALGSTCQPNPCTVTLCRADFDNNNLVEVSDIFAFLSAWFARCP